MRHYIHAERQVIMSYYSDIDFKVVVLHRFLYDAYQPGVVENHSIEFIRKGRLMLEYDNRVIELNAPAVFWMRSGKSYRFFFDGAKPSSCEHIYFDFCGSRSDRMLAELEKSIPSGKVTPADPNFVSDLFARILTNYRLDPVNRLPEMVVDVERLVLHIFQSSKRAARAKEDPYRIWKIAEKIRSDPFGDFDFPAEAAKAGISYEHFRRLFREYHNAPLKTYIFNQQMSVAAEMLAKTDMRIKEVMETCNFDSMMNFSRSFKRYSGLSPAAYRKKHNDL